MDADKDMEMLQKALDALGEHFDSVQIFATRHDSGGSGGTIGVKRGCGNWFARYGQVREWMIQEEQSSRNNVAKEEDE